MNNESTSTTQEVPSGDRLLAMLCHLSAFLGGIILPIIIWATQKDKSKFVRFHSLQAIFYHIALAAIIIVFFILMIIVLLISGVGMGIFENTDYTRGNGGPPAIFFIMIILFYGGIFIIAFGGIGYAIYLAVKSYQGYLIKIPIIGNIIYKKVYES